MITLSRALRQTSSRASRVYGGSGAGTGSYGRVTADDAYTSWGNVLLRVLYTVRSNSYAFTTADSLGVSVTSGITGGGPRMVSWMATVQPFGPGTGPMEIDERS